MPQDKTISEAAAELVAEFEGAVDLLTSDVEERLNTYNEMSVPVDEAQRSVRKDLKSDHNVDDNELAAQNTSEHSVADIESDEQWIDLVVNFVEEWEPNSDSIAQVGLLGDETGTIKFVAFETSDLPTLEVGQSYRLTNVVTDEYNGNYSVKLNRSSGITAIDKEIEVANDQPDEATITGAIVDVKGKSGLIDRCPNEGCTRVLKDGRCSEHGEVDGELDMRIKAILDTGADTYTAYFGKEATAELSGIGFEEAQSIAKDKLDKSAVIDEMTPAFIGRYVEATGTISGSEYGDRLFVNEFDTDPDIVPESPDGEIVQPAREIQSEVA